MEDELEPISALRRRVRTAHGTRQLVGTWRRLRFRWHLAAAVAAVALLVALAVGCVDLFSSDEWGGKLAGIAAGIAVVYAGYQVRLTRAIAKQTLSYQYFERFSSYSLKEPYLAAKDFALTRPRDKTEELRRWEEFVRWGETDPKKVAEIIFIFNFFEELGGVYKHGAVDRRVIDEYLGKFALRFWKELDWFMWRFRKERTSSVFEDWEAMCKAVEDGQDGGGGGSR